MTSERNRLRVVKLLHTVVWAFFASCILAIPFFAAASKFEAVVVLMGVVSIEILVLVLNRWRCPLTDVAAHFTDDRRDNFDIYLPLWLARYNKQVFSLLLVAGLVFAGVRWFGWFR